ncbi:MAG: flagellar hook-associated protein FlgK [Gammaproteobacteria bacterium]|nr:MAG: flagellar hook-associated protein FlgK [Gammaproteobacteria bacterium]
MTSGLNIGISGLRAQQLALSTTAHNIANANNPGYSRQITEMGTNPPQGGGGTFFGTGVSVLSVNRSYDPFLTNRVRFDTVSFNEFNQFHASASSVDNLLADPSTGVTPALKEFFDAMQTASTDSSSTPLRQVVISEGGVLVNRFGVLYSQLDQQNELANQQLKTIASEISVLAEGIADLNIQISTSQGSSAASSPNDLLDQRDEAIRRLAELVGVQIIEQNDGTINISIGNGQPLIVGAQFRTVGTIPGRDDASIDDVVFSNRTGTINSVITAQITGGKMGGVIDFREQILSPAFRELGRVAVSLSFSVNEQHEEGMDLEGDINQRFFSDMNSSTLAQRRVIIDGDNNNTSSSDVNVTIRDVNELTSSDYALSFSGTGNLSYSLVRLSDNEVVTTGTLTNIYPVNIWVDGLSVNLESGPFASGDRFILQPTRFGARDIDLEIESTENLAFAVPVVATASSENSGTGITTSGRILDIDNATFSTTANELTPPILIRFTSGSRYDVLDNTDPSNPIQMVPPMRNQMFIPGFPNDIFTEDSRATSIQSVDASVGVSQTGANNLYAATVISASYRDPTTNLITTFPNVTTTLNDSAASIASQINTGFNGITASAHTEVTLANQGGGTTITVNGEAVVGLDFNAWVDSINTNTTLAVQGVTAYLSGNNLLLRDAQGEDVSVVIAGGNLDVGGTTFGAGSTVTTGGSVQVVMGEGWNFSTDGAGVFAGVPARASTYLGYQVTISGKPEVGDTFDIEYNTSGFSDNRNLLELVALEDLKLMENGTATYAESYGGLVESVGALTNEASIRRETQESLLRQSVSDRDNASAVNLDEEAARLIEFEVAYNASAQVVSIARSLFDTLINAIS